MKGKLLVGNISTDADETHIRSLFEGTSGRVFSVFMQRDPKSGKNRGYAVVEMYSDVDAQTAMDDLNGKDVEGRQLCISLVAASRKPRKWYQFKGSSD